MVLKKGNLWTSSAHCILVTANATIRKDGALVMGRGAAQQAANLIPSLPWELGRLIGKSGREYGVIISPLQYKGSYIGIFQVKHDFADNADTYIIQRSVDKLNRIITKEGKQYAMNFPGIGYGRLPRSIILPLISVLPDNVEVWEYA